MERGRRGAAGEALQLEVAAGIKDAERFSGHGNVWIRRTLDTNLGYENYDRDVTQEDVKEIRRLCEESAARRSYFGRIAIAHAFGFTGPEGQLESFLADRLRSILPASGRSGFDTHDVRAIERHFRFAAALGEPSEPWDAVLNAIWSRFPAGTMMKALPAKEWAEAIDIGRALVELNVYRIPDWRVDAVASAALRLKESGFRLVVDAGEFAFSPGELERATALVQRCFDRLGPVGVLTNIFRILRETEIYSYGIFLPGPKYTLGPRDPSLPFGFLISLAVRAAVPQHTPERPEQEWFDAVMLARDIAAVLNVEPYTQFETLNLAPERLERLLRDIALYDHLFRLRQWAPEHAPSILRAFFCNPQPENAREGPGCTGADGATFCDTVLKVAKSDPAVIGREDLLRAGMSTSDVDRLVTQFVHSRGSVNVGYVSPITANDKNANLMFKPLIEIADDTWLLPARPLAGPAFYEAVLLAMRSKQQPTTDLLGQGTENTAIALLKRAGLSPTITAEKYKIGADEGECDVVLESPTEIVFVECKAKALTRATMAGEPGNALLDFAAGMFAAQLQALRHERILRTRGSIEFLTGRELQHGGRRITRLSVTLLDHGALQDRILLWNLYDTLLQSDITCEPSYRRFKEAAAFKKSLDDFRREVNLLTEAGHTASAQTLAASLSVGQLGILLEDVANLEQFVRRITFPVTTASFNAVREYVQMRTVKPEI
jgi:hypothetical protein